MAAPPQSRLTFHGNPYETAAESGNEVLFVLLGLGAGCGCLLLAMLGIIGIAMLPFFLGRSNITEKTETQMCLATINQFQPVTIDRIANSQHS
ncbi:MAG: hypothetical protein AAFN08_01285 [Cyanobacteria bacterium J06559_3]